MVADFIAVKGAAEHNLKNVDLKIPKNKLVVFTGLSGSGKSSLAFDTLYAEGQRRYVESLSSYARQFLGMMKKPQVDTITGLSPAISIDQKSVSANPRSTVGTITEIYDYFRLLFAKIGRPHCPECGREITVQSLDQISKLLVNAAWEKSQMASSCLGRFMILSPVVRGRKGEFTGLFKDLQKKGFSQARIDGQVFDLDKDFVLIKTNNHNIDLVVDKFIIDSRKNKQEYFQSGAFQEKLTNSLETALKISDGLVILAQVLDSGFSMPKNPVKFEDMLFSEKFSCPDCNLSIPEIQPRTFSFNSPFGACPGCTGLGSIQRIDEARLINPELSLSEGGILAFANLLSSDSWYSRTFRTVAEVYGIPLRLPIVEIPKEKLKILLYGTGNKIFTVLGLNRFGNQTSIQTTFDGLIPNLEKKYQDSESDFIQAEIQKFMTSFQCPQCKGKRLKPEALAVTVDNLSIDDVCRLSIRLLKQWLAKLPLNLTSREQNIAGAILKEINNRVSFLNKVGLDYLTLNRAAASLAGGEAQRIRLASQIGSGLSGVLYILDEPSIGLHQKDNAKLIETLKNLRDLGNTVIVVEHDREMMEAADWLVDFGPQAGSLGGQVIFSGTLPQFKKTDTLTARFLKKTSPIEVITDQKPSSNWLAITHCSHHNLKNIDVRLPLGKFICITGVSGSGKSTLVDDTLYHALAARLHRYHSQKPGSFEKLEGWEKLKNVILVDQSPIGRTPRSNPATYVGAFNYIREMFTNTRAAREKGYQQGRFSFNVKGGRCESCQGEGQNKIEMQFLAPIWVDCEVCQGKRYNKQTLEIEYKGKNIYEILQMTIDEALKFFPVFLPLSKKLQTLKDVGLGYLKLGQPAPTLSGGEAQRIKLAKELSKSGLNNVLYILDEPTTGLHYEDLKKLLQILRRLVEKGHTVLVIEHNLDVISQADWIIDLGPEGGDSGGQVVACGPLPELINQSNSYTGRFLKAMLK